MQQIQPIQKYFDLFNLIREKSAHLSTELFARDENLSMVILYHPQKRKALSHTIYTVPKSEKLAARSFIQCPKTEGFRTNDLNCSQMQKTSGRSISIIPKCGRLANGCSEPLPKGESSGTIKMAKAKDQ